MAGYDNFAKMSNNAVEAYKQGIKPLSQITKKDLASVGLSISLSFAIWLAEKKYWVAKEWHHCGKKSKCKKVYFYKPKQLAYHFKKIDKKGAVRQLFNRSTQSSPKNITEKPLRVFGWFPKKGNQKKRKKFEGTKQNGWIYFDGGGKQGIPIRKKAKGQHIQWGSMKQKKVKK